MASKTLPALLCGGFVAATVASTCYVFVTFGTYCFASSPQTLQTLASVAPGLGDVHLMAGREQGLGQMGTDEPGTAGDEDAHRNHLEKDRTAATTSACAVAVSDG